MITFENFKDVLAASINVVSMSGGKDSTAQALLALEKFSDVRFVFADTGHEHQKTYEYIDYLKQRLGIQIETVKADFTKQIKRKAEVVKTKWVDEGSVTESQAQEIAELLKPTGIPFLDLCLWKGRFPSTRARFCSSELKHAPIDSWMLNIAKQGRVISWQGVRADESPSRAKLQKIEWGEYGSIIYRPILNWTAAQVFKKHFDCGVEPNPLYKDGMGRVGCMPCIHGNKKELAQIALRFPEEVARVSEWERLVSSVSKRGTSTFFHASTDPMIATKNNAEISYESHGIYNIIEWAKTSRGGRQMDLLRSLDDPSMCSSQYGLCE